MVDIPIINVLYVDDDIQNLKSFSASFRRQFNIFTAPSASEAEIILAKNTIHVLITDQRMPVKTGTELLAETVKNFPDQSRILLTAYSDKQVLIDAINEGKIYMFLEKPWDDKLLQQTIKEGYLEFLHKQSLKNDIKRLTKQNLRFKKTVRKRKR